MRRGALVLKVYPDSPAAEAGLAENDVIVSAGGHAVASREDVTTALYTAAAGTPLERLVGDVRALLAGAPAATAEPASAPNAASVPPLAGVRVLDLTRYLAGPHGTLLLAQLGAEVIKVEPPQGGDAMRAVSLHFQAGLSAHFVSGNASKKSSKSYENS